MRLWAFWLALAFWGTASPASAHGTGARFIAAPTQVVEFYYTDGEVMAYAEAKAFSPDAPDVPYFNGRTDKLGRLAFSPDRPGLWRVDARDTEGHTARIDVDVDANGARPSRLQETGTWILFGSLALNLLFAGIWIVRDERRRSGKISGPDKFCQPAA